jgi:hypothetical protein
MFHLDALEFCDRMVADGVVADAVLFDPPYSPRQISELYQSIGRSCSATDTQNARLYSAVKRGLDALLRPICAARTSRAGVHLISRVTPTCS